MYLAEYYLALDDDGDFAGGLLRGEKCWFGSDNNHVDVEGRAIDDGTVKADKPNKFGREIDDRTVKADKPLPKRSRVRRPPVRRSGAPAGVAWACAFCTSRTDAY